MQIRRASKMAYTKKQARQKKRADRREKRRQNKITGKRRTGVKGKVATKAGAYPIYKKGSKNAKAFGAAHESARNKGLKTFTHDGRKYNTDKKVKTRTGAEYVSKVGDRVGNLKRRGKALATQGSAWLKSKRKKK